MGPSKWIHHLAEEASVWRLPVPREKVAEVSVPSILGASGLTAVVGSHRSSAAAGEKSAAWPLDLPRIGQVQMKTRDVATTHLRQIIGSLAAAGLVEWSWEESQAFRRRQLWSSSAVKKLQQQSLR